MRWFYRRLLDAPQMPKVSVSGASREGLRFGKSIQGPEPFFLRLAESIWKNSLNLDGPGSELTSGIAREAPCQMITVAHIQRRC